MKLKNIRLKLQGIPSLFVGYGIFGYVEVLPKLKIMKKDMIEFSGLIIDLVRDKSSKDSLYKFSEYAWNNLIYPGLFK